MFILQPINRWGPQPVKSYYVTGTFWAGREVVKWGFHDLVMELEREKHCFQSWGEELSESSEKLWGGGCLRKTWSGSSMDVVRRLVLEGWRAWLGERQRRGLLYQKGSLTFCHKQWQKAGCPLFVVTPSPLNLIKQFTLQRIWNIINSTLKYPLNLLSSIK